MSYKIRFEAALGKTKELGLMFQGVQYPFQAPLSFEVKRKVLQSCVDVLFAHGYQNSSSLAGKCTPIHLMMHRYLKDELGIDSYITIGDYYWNDYIYCEMSYEIIKSELTQLDITKPLKAHVWLTLTDGTIIDCTLQGHADLLFNRGDFPVEKCLTIVEINSSEDEVSGYHRPYLVGSDFLMKACAMYVM
ncbi:hypothetical protein [Rheinheimera sp. 1928-s]|uniref:hypothetical protein n=1 Tax=Rheinheimera sp. 1928-s TaxID=3033803 RepID=UPI0026377B03|nr:hypothetical protein [Rheinheimera sp. 1928-s]MDF3124196.1 hypothetical protein [Rheinheimera sp. 1928-s]